MGLGYEGGVVTLLIAKLTREAWPRAVRRLGSSFSLPLSQAAPAGTVLVDDRQPLEVSPAHG
jgi:hypothetical protein